MTVIRCQSYSISLTSHRRVLTKHNLNIKPYIIIRIVMQQYTPNVPDALSKTAQYDGDHVRPGLVPDAQVKVYQERDTEESGEEGVGWKGGIVAVYCAFDRAFRAYCFTPLGDARAVWCSSHFVLM
jgi:hypothetical protein